MAPREQAALCLRYVRYACGWYAWPRRAARRLRGVRVSTRPRRGASLSRSAPHRACAARRRWDGAAADVRWRAHPARTPWSRRRARRSRQAPPAACCASAVDVPSALSRRKFCRGRLGRVFVGWLVRERRAGRPINPILGYVTYTLRPTTSGTCNLDTFCVLPHKWWNWTRAAAPSPSR